MAPALPSTNTNDYLQSIWFAPRHASTPHTTHHTPHTGTPVSPHGSYLTRDPASTPFSASEQCNCALPRSPVPHESCRFAISTLAYATATGRALQSIDMSMIERLITTDDRHLDGLGGRRGERKVTWRLRLRREWEGSSCVQVQRGGAARQLVCSPWMLTSRNTTDD